jgi:iron complex outermembrane receptor protein
VETEATYFLGGGVTAYGNASINRAVFKGSKLDVPTVPKSTAAFGLIAEHAGFFGSFAEKYVGSWTVYDTITNPDVAGAGASRAANSQSYLLGDVSIGYGRKLSHGFIRSFKIRLQISNVFNEKIKVLDGIDANVANAYTKDTFNVLPGRNTFLTVSGEF